ncbi:MAG: LysM peptidoglycan-binding domain-containing protein [Xanthomonadaceae bacterium]|nr:LysM peptidoglycan-binding domain-containing protein [Rhodospirillaceae bacterium]NIA17878.1 LysM peptidoglycan-binding domain-containing protein [Xanthomonadaceae bacterium]
MSIKMNSSSFENPLLKYQNIKKKKKNFEKKMTRRDFLKLAGTTAVVMGGPKVFADYEKIASFLENTIKFFKEDNEEDIREIEKIEDIIQGEEKELAPEEQQEQEDYKNINEIFRMGLNEPIEINIKNSLITQEYWEKQHSENPKYVNSFKVAFKRMKKYEDSLRKIFREEGTPEKFMYLAIPESYWNWEKRPGKKAKGPYQFTKRTGRKFGLKINRKIDERFDPLKSGRACAKYLKYLYDKTGNWDIALAGYNGSLIWDYLREEKEDKSYEKFLAYIESRARKDKEEILENKFFSYYVRRKETVWRISNRFKVSMEELKKINNIGQNNKIKTGQKLKIPIKDKRAVEKIYTVKMSKYVENLNYPPKFNAIIKLINDGFVKH